MANPGDFAYTLKQQADIVRLVGDYVKLRKTGGQNFTGLCPFHNEKTPSFSVHATRQFFHCFGCGESGDVFKFIQKIENISFPEAVRLVAQKMGVAVPKATFNSETEAREARVRGALLDIHERATAWFEEQLRRPEAAHARAYLAGREMSEAARAQFRIGYAPDSGFLLRDFLRRDFSEDLLKESGLFSFKQTEPPAGPQPGAFYSRFRNRVMFPICNESGRVIAFTGRTLSADEKSGPKYLNSPETPIYSKSHVLFNLDKAKRSIRERDYAILVEGQMDCISVSAAGIPNVIATSGTAFTEAQARLIGRFSKNIVVNFDPDTAGAKAAERSLALLVEQEFQIKVVTLERGYDPDLFIRRKGVEEYATALRQAPRYFDYLIEQARARFARSPEGKAKAAEFLLPHLQRVPGRILRDELANEVAQKLGIDAGTLRQELKHTAARGPAAARSLAVPSLTPAERIVARALASAEGAEWGPELRLLLASEALHEGLAGEKLIDCLLQNEGADPLALPLAADDRNLLAELLMMESAELTAELLESSIQTLRQMKYLRGREEVKRQIAEAERRRDEAALARLYREKLELDRKFAAR